MPMTDSLDVEIQSLLAELVDAAPPAPLLDVSELDAKERSITKRRSSGWVPHPSRWLALGGAFVVAVVTVVLVTILLPSSAHLTPNAAAVQLQQIASNAAQQPAVSLGPNQWLQVDHQQSTYVQLFPVIRSQSHPNHQTTQAEATISSTVQQWSNASGTSCISLTSGTAEFATLTNKAAWLAAGFLSSPTPSAGPRNGCAPSTTIGAQGNGVGPAGAFDVARLPTDPQALARELMDGTTGVKQIDQLSGGGNVTGFERATAILVGPTTGATPSFNAALIGALALMPGIQPRGQMTSHLQKSGLGFSADPHPVEGTSTIIVEPATGALLETRNVPDTLSEESLVMGFESSFSAPDNYGIRQTTQWLDPISTPTVVNTGALPPAISSSLPPHQ